MRETSKLKFETTFTFTLILASGMSYSVFAQEETFDYEESGTSLHILMDITSDSLSELDNDGKQTMLNVVNSAFDTLATTIPISNEFHSILDEAISLKNNDQFDESLSKYQLALNSYDSWYYSEDTEDLTSSVTQEGTYSNLFEKFMPYITDNPNLSTNEINLATELYEKSKRGEDILLSELDDLREIYFKGKDSLQVSSETIVKDTSEDGKSGGGCLIATATFGSELAPQVQQLRELRDNTLMQTSSGMAFMTTFNQFYYSFSPTIADLEREHPVFKEMVKSAITPMLFTLSLLNYADIDSEEDVLGYGIGIMLLNLGMYFVIPFAAVFSLRKHVHSKRRLHHND